MSARIDSLVTVVANHLQQRKFKIVTAESCTGGGVAFYLTNLAGSSNWFDRGIVSYSNAAKIEILGVNAQTLADYGAVSEQVAKEMALGALKISQAQVSIAITGIAGPSGGSKEKPVGTVWFGWGVTDKLVQTQLCVFQGNRAEVREQAIILALEGFLKLL